MVNSQENIKSFLRETVYVGQLDHSLNLSKNSLPAAISQERCCHSYISMETKRKGKAFMALKLFNYKKEPV